MIALKDVGQVFPSSQRRFVSEERKAHGSTNDGCWGNRQYKVILYDSAKLVIWRQEKKLKALFFPPESKDRQVSR